MEKAEPASGDAQEARAMIGSSHPLNTRKQIVMNIKNKVLIGTISALGVSGIGIGTALAAQRPSPPPSTTTSSVTGPAANVGGPDTAPEATGTKADPVEAPGTPGANHQDADNVNVDFTPPGETAEPAGATS